MGLRTRNMEFGAISNEILASSSTASTFSELPSGHRPAQGKYRYCFDDFSTALITGGSLNTGAAAVGTTGATNVFATRWNVFHSFILGAGQTIIVPTRVSAGGILASLDKTDNEGHEIHMGVHASSEFAFTCGTDAAFFFRVKFTLADVSGTDDCAVGFRKVEACQANVDDYDEAAFLNVILGDIKIETILNNAATTTTDTTNNWLDTETHTLQVNISAARAVTYLIDGAAPIVTAGFTFDSGEVVMPFFYFLHATTSPTDLTILEWECGYQDPGSY